MLKIRSRAVACSILCAMVLLGTAVAKPVYSMQCLSLNLPSSTITQGTSSILVTGFSRCPSGLAVFVILSQVSPSLASCQSASRVPGTIISTYSKIAKPNYAVTITTSSLSPGSYCVTVESASLAYYGSRPLTVTPAAIPEYPFGISILATLMIIAYGLIKRATITEKIP